MTDTHEVINGRRVPTQAIRLAHKRADETGVDHAVMFLTGDIGMSDGKFGGWFAVPLVPVVSVAGLNIAITDDMWCAAPYVAIPEEDHS